MGVELCRSSEALPRILLKDIGVRRGRTPFSFESTRRLQTDAECF
jgi:hypothetical protein